MVIEEYNENWKEQFKAIKNILEGNLSKIQNIEHVGSTAIVGMCAKPIIDIDIIIDNVNDFHTIKKELEFIGYYHNGDQGITGREAFGRTKLQHTILDKIDHHLYVCAKDNEELRRHILFRNYLNKNDKNKEKYYKIKKGIIEKIGNEDRENYVLIKEMEYKWFFEAIIKQAEEENEKI